MNSLARSRLQTHRLLPLTAFASCLQLASGPAAEVPIGVNFAENTSYQLAPTEIAGAPGFEHSNWNNRGRWGDPSALANGSGVATPVTMKWDATGIWENDANASLGGNHKMMKGYLDSNGAIISTAFNGVFGSADDKPTILVTGLDTWLTQNNLTSYSVVVYSDGDSSAGDRATRVWLAATNPSQTVNGDPGLGPDLTSRVDIVDQSNWGANPTFTRVTGSSGVGNYTVFRGLTAGAFYIRIDEAGTTPWRAPLNAFQIIGTDVAVDPDTDNDGMPDSWEDNHGLDPEDDGTEHPELGPDGDLDNDGLTNLQEYNNGSNSTNPRQADTDGDGLNDGDELSWQTNPVNPDTDGDNLPDGWEVAHGLNPLDPGTNNFLHGADGDPDSDTLTNLEEYNRGTNPTLADTDGDTLSDAVENGSGTWVSPTSTGTSPILADTDRDGIPDNVENPDDSYVAGSTPGTDPNNADTDGDGHIDGWEYYLGSDPTLNTSTLPSVAVQNASFEAPDAAGSYINGTPDGWSLSGTGAVDRSWVENLGAAALTGGYGSQYAGIQALGAYLYQDTGVPFAPDTTYVVDISSGYRDGFPTGVIEFGLYSSDSIGTPVAGYPGRMDLDGIRPLSGNPDADGRFNVLRSATTVTHIGSGSLGRPYSFVTGDTPPSGNIVVYARHASGFRVMLDNVRILAIPNAIDEDADGLPDAWELANRLSPLDNGFDLEINGPAGDPDEDGSDNARELAAGSNPRDSDTDDDGLSDGVETLTGVYVGPADTGTSPIKQDTDGDGLFDNMEITLGTNPNLVDTDGDSFSDLEEILAGTDPNDDQSFPITAEVRVASFGRNGNAFDLSVVNLVASRSYQLTRSIDLITFTPVGDPVTGTTTHTFSDPSAPAGSAYYRVEEVETP